VLDHLHDGLVKMRVGVGGHRVIEIVGAGRQDEAHLFARKPGFFTRIKEQLRLVVERVGTTRSTFFASLDQCQSAYIRGKKFRPSHPSFSSRD
jgi:hypothetical protein